MRTIEANLYIKPLHRPGPNHVVNELSEVPDAHNHSGDAVAAQEAELLLIQPRVVVPLGSLSCLTLVGRPLREVRGVPVRREGLLFVERGAEDRQCPEDGPRCAQPELEQLARRVGIARFDDPVIPRSYWYVSAGLATAALVLGVLLGRFLLG